MKNSEIGYRIKERRTELGLTQAQVASKAHLSTSQICYLESGKRSPSALIINTLSDVLECSVDWLLKGMVSNNQEATTISPVIPAPESTSENTTFSNVKKMLDMYLYIDEVDQEEIRLLLELKYRKKEKEWSTLISDLIQSHTDSSTL